MSKRKTTENESRQKRKECAIDSNSLWTDGWMNRRMKDRMDGWLYPRTSKIQKNQSRKRKGKFSVCAGLFAACGQRNLIVPIYLCQKFIFAKMKSQQLWVHDSMILKSSSRCGRRRRRTSAKKSHSKNIKSHVRAVEQKKNKKIVQTNKTKTSGCLPSLDESNVCGCWLRWFGLFGRQKIARTAACSEARLPLFTIKC